VAHRLTFEYDQGSALNARQVLGVRLNSISNEFAVRNDPAGGTLRHISLAVDDANEADAEVHARNILRDALQVDEDELTMVQVDLLGTVEPTPPPQALPSGDTATVAEDDDVIDVDVVGIDDEPRSKKK
jgi:hypothetical protein